MTGTGLVCLRCGPSVTVQDTGRPGALAEGLSRGGAIDILALHEGAALLGQGTDCAVLEMAGMGGTFEARGALLVALTGAPMRATLDGVPLRWNACHPVPDGARLEIGGAERGVYGYLSVRGGFRTPMIVGARSAHLNAGIGRAVAAGDMLPAQTATGRPRVLRVADRFSGGTIRIMDSPQTELFPQSALDTLTSQAFLRDPRGNRMGVRLDPEGAAIALDGGLSILSDVIVPGDIQITGDGAPFLLLAECQTTGGYPRIATVLPCDMPRAAQAAPGDRLRFDRVGLERATALHRAWLDSLAALPRRVENLVRDPREIDNLNEYQLVSGMTSGQYEGDE